MGFIPSHSGEPRLHEVIDVLDAIGLKFIGRKLLAQSPADILERMYGLVYDDRSDGRRIDVIGVVGHRNQSEVIVVLVAVGFIRRERCTRFATELRVVSILIDLAFVHPFVPSTAGWAKAEVARPPQVGHPCDA